MKYKAFGETKSLTSWSKDERCTVSRKSIAKRISKGMSIEKAITQPRKNINSGAKKRTSLCVTAFGETKVITEWEKDERCCADYRVIFKRLVQLKWNTEEAIITPVRSIDKTNPSGIKGVSFIKSSGKWKAYTNHNKKRIIIGHYQTKEAAAEAVLNYKKTVLNQECYK